MDERTQQPFTYAQAVDEWHFTRWQLATSRFRRLFHGVYIEAKVDMTPALWVAAAQLVLPADATITGETALAVAGVRCADPYPVRAVSKRHRTSRRDGIELRECHTHQPGISIASPLGSLADACQRVDLLHGVTLADECLRRRLITADDLAEWRVGRLGRVAALARPGADSARETMLRLLMVLAGLPEPELQVDLGDVAGWIGRVDTYFREFKVVIEYEGDGHRKRGQWTKDIDRYERLRRAGYHVVRVTSEHMLNPAALVARIHEELRSHGYRGPAPVLGTEWLDAFGHLLRSAA